MEPGDEADPPALPAPEVRDNAPAVPIAAPSGLGSVPDRTRQIAELLREHYRAVYGYCVRILRDSSLAEDVAQQVFLEAHRDFDFFKGTSSARTWLFGIAFHRCQDAIRRRRRLDTRTTTDELLEVVPDASAAPTARVDHNWLTAALEGCLQELSPDSRAAVLARFWCELSYEEMAEPLAAKADTLQTRVSRAMDALRRCLTRQGWSRE
ncbi:MAG TPA: RNA polymerase sigma factor [Kofleriaceae bacterium]